MKIALKLNFKQLTEIIKAMQQDVYTPAPETIADKAAKYQFENIFKKLLKKQIDKYETRNEFRVAIPYAEAAILFVKLQEVNITDNYRMAVILKFTHSLHQQLISK
jgi:LPS sulfotransferase NodH